MIPIPEELLEQIERGDVILFAGERLTRDAQGNVAVDWLIEELAARCGFSDEANLTFPQLAQIYQDDRNRHELVRFMRDRLEALGDKPDRSHHLIARLTDCRVLVTTSLTKRLERAFEAAGRPLEVIVGDVDVVFGRDDKATLYKLRGSLKDPDSLILTEDDHHDFFHKNTNFLSVLQSYLARKTLLFVGYDLGDRLFQRLYREVTRPLNNYARTAYAFGEAPPPLVSRWCKRHNIDVVEADTETFLQDLLRQLAERRPATALLPPQPPAPFQAPLRPSLFVGREAELAEFCEMIARSAGHSIYCLVGMAGIGKTAFAIRAAHALCPFFDDGVLWARVATEEPLTILDRWTHAYGDDYSTLPDLDRRAAELRHLLAGKQALIVLDDVRSLDQVQPFLVDGPRCIVLLTTRDRSVAVDVSKYKNIRSLGALAPGQSRQLMAHIVGEKRIVQEQDCADQICQLLGHLPLAVEITAKKLAIDPSMSLADMLAWLRSEKNQAQTRHSLDPEVRASFAVSWHVLDEEMRWTFSLLAVFGGRAITADAFAAVAQMERWPAQSRLTAFVALSLLTGEGQGCYRQHPLLVEFALERLAELTAQRPQDQEEAYVRMVRYYLAYAVKHQQDYDQLEQEWDNLSAAMQEAVERQMWQEVIDFGEALTEAWFAWGHFSEARQAYGWACEAAQALDDQPALAANLQRWGRACIEQGDYRQAGELLSSSIQIYRDLDDPFGVASTQSYLGRLFYDKAEYGAAQQVLEEAQSTLVEEGDHEYTARVLYLQAMIQYDHDQLEAAQLLAETALEFQQPLDDKAGAMRTLTLLAEVACDRGHYDLAIEKCEAALDLGKQIQDKTEMAATLYTLCKVLRRKGDAHSALEKGSVSLALSKQLGDRRVQAQTLSLMSEIHLDLGEPGTALSVAQQSLELCYELEDLWGAVWVLRTVGDAYLALDQRQESREAWSEALRLATGRSHPLTQSLIDRLGH